MEKDYLNRHWKVAKHDIEEKINELIALSGGEGSENHKFYQEMLLTLSRVIQEDTERWDVKILNQTLKEIERSFTMLRQYKRRCKVTVYGSARTQPEHIEFKLAHDLGAKLADNNFMAITGAGAGIMEAAHIGAGIENSIGLNIDLPFEKNVNSVMEANPAALLEFKFFFIRKLFFVKEADALVLFPGGFGTQDENFEVLTLVQTGKSPIVPIILIDTPEYPYWAPWLEFMDKTVRGGGYISDCDMSLFEHTHDPQEVIDIINNFYSNFHSTRNIQDMLYIRTNRKLPQACLDRLNGDFADIIVNGTFENVPAHEYEADEQELKKLSRMAFHFNGKDYGRLRQLINVINEY